MFGMSRLEKDLENINQRLRALEQGREMRRDLISELTLDKYKIELFSNGHGVKFDLRHLLHQIIAHIGLSVEGARGPRLTVKGGPEKPE